MANGLNDAQVDAMLQLLSTDDTYRSLFTSNLAAALAQLPGSPPIPPNLAPDCCLFPKSLASKADIARTRVLLERYKPKLDVFIPKLFEP